MGLPFFPSHDRWGFVGIDFVVPTDEDELFYKLKETAYKIAVEFFNGHEPEERMVTPFFIICDELGLDETFKQRILEEKDA